jgi:hypothetical protein
MSSFTTPLVVTPSARGGLWWRLVEPFEYHVGSYPSPEVIRIPAGFETDFASIPRPLWIILPPYDAEYGKAAVVHDWLWQQSRSKQDRRRAAVVFGDALRVLAAPLWKRVAMTAAVKLYAEFKPL